MSRFDDEGKQIYDQILEYLFTMNNEQLSDVREYIESMLAGEGEEQ